MPSYKSLSSSNTQNKVALLSGQLQFTQFVLGIFICYAYMISQSQNGSQRFGCHRQIEPSLLIGKMGELDEARILLLLIVSHLYIDKIM